MTRRGGLKLLQYKRFMKHVATRFAIRWIGSGLGLWIAAAILGSSHMAIGGGSTKTWVAATVAGFILAVINMFIKPLLIFLSLPAIIITLGLFMLVVNGLTILIVSWLYDPLFVSSIWSAIVAGIIIGLVNYLVSRVLEDLK